MVRRVIRWTAAESSQVPARLRWWRDGLVIQVVVQFKEMQECLAHPDHIRVIGGRAAHRAGSATVPAPVNWAAETGLRLRQGY